MMAHHDPSPLASPLDAAQVLTARGWVVFPADHPDAALHCTGTATRCREGRCGADDDPGKRGKHPRVPWGRLAAPVSAAQLRDWFGEGGANVAVACGPSGLLVVDEDTEGAFAAFAAAVGETVPDTFRVRTARGWHWYFAVPVDPVTGERTPLGNAPGALGPWHCDVRGGASASAPHGGYVITAGSTHASGIVYTAPEPYREAIEAPQWLITAILTPVPAGPPAPVEGSPVRAGSRDGHGTAGVARYDDDPRYGTDDPRPPGTIVGLRGTYALLLARLAAVPVGAGGPWRTTLMPAARNGWRLVHKGLLTEAELLRDLNAQAARVWPAEHRDARSTWVGALDDADRVIVWEEALTGPRGAIADPWSLLPSEAAKVRAWAAGDPSLIAPEIESASRFSRSAPALTSDDRMINRTTDGNVAGENITLSDVPPVATVDGAGITDDPLLAKEVEDQRRRQRAREIIAAESLPPLTMLGVDEWDATPDLSYLVPRLFYRNALASVFGAPGVGKSYFLLDIALSLATGRPWRGTMLTGRDGGRGIVHYVMAEGLDVNKNRRNAWLHHHGVDRSELHEHFVVTDGEGVSLTMAGIAQYRRYVQEDRPDLIILDTKNALFTGEEASARDHGEMIRALNTLRKDAGGATVVLIGHSGLKDETRSRGSNAEEAGASTATRITRDEGTGLFTAFEKRDKSAGATPAQWHWRLERVDEVPVGPFMDPPAVCVPTEVGEHQPFAVEGAWWTDETPVPDGVLAIRGKGREMSMRIFRVLRWVGGDRGLTRAEVRTALQQRPGERSGKEFDSSGFYAAFGKLEKAGAGAFEGARFVLVPPYDGEGCGTGTALG